MTISIFDLFSIGIGPSSSHTVGPMRASKAFIESFSENLTNIKTVKVVLYGSLAFTGKGHGTDRAILMGLAGDTPEAVDPDLIRPHVEQIKTEGRLTLLKQHRIAFDYDQDLIFNHLDKLPDHSNGMKFIAEFDDGSSVEKIYYSIGGGFIQEEGAQQQSVNEVTLAYPFSSGADLLDICNNNHMTIAEIMMANEKTWHDEPTVRKKLLEIAKVMEDSIEKGCHTPGTLEGRLQVRRRAPALYKRLLQEGKPTPQHPHAMSWLNAFAMAIKEENASGSRVVTAPTNGAAGIIPAVMHFYRLFYNGHDVGVIRYLLTAGAIGMLYKQNASISGAEMGCQGEVGVACSMAAAGLTAALGGDHYQIENAAEIAMEHNLGLTCDPVDGLVQIPCIERNAMGAVKAVNATQLALAGDGQHHVSLDAVIKTMYEIGTNMNSIYKETSLGGLAVNVVEC